MQRKSKANNPRVTATLRPEIRDLLVGYCDITGCTLSKGVEDMILNYTAMKNIFARKNVVTQADLLLELEQLRTGNKNLQS